MRPLPLMAAIVGISGIIIAGVTAGTLAALVAKYQTPPPTSRITAAQGERGPTGDPGVASGDLANSDTGPTGAIGVTGISVTQVGPTGSAGAMGPTGLASVIPNPPIGNTGATGPASTVLGPTGAVGFTGPPQAPTGGITPILYNILAGSLIVGATGSADYFYAQPHVISVSMRPGNLSLLPSNDPLTIQFVPASTGVPDINSQPGGQGSLYFSEMQLSYSPYNWPAGRWTSANSLDLVFQGPDPTTGVILEVPMRCTDFTSQTAGFELLIVTN